MTMHQIQATFSRMTSEFYYSVNSNFYCLGVQRGASDTGEGSQGEQ